MAVKAKVKEFQEAMSNMLPPSAVQAATLSNMFLSIYGGLWLVHVSKFRPGPISRTGTKGCQ